MTKALLLTIIAFVSSYVLAQTNTIMGRTFGANQEILANVSITCKSKNSRNILAYTFSSVNGYYKMVIPAKRDTVELIASALGYARDSITVTFDQLDKNYTHDFLLKPVTIGLTEINISVKSPPISSIKDTTTFSVSAFIDGTEKVVEDVLKKLPGIDVSENGDIKFKGKKIDEVQFEGDNLLGNNYKLGTKNLSAIMIDKVQAIENYNNTTLLKGIKKGNKTILNLQLKNNFKKPLALNNNANIGINSKYDIGINLISITKRFKGFAIANGNNVGEDNTPFNFTMDEMEDDDETLLLGSASKIISNQVVFPEIKESRYNFNNRILFSPAALYKFSDRFRFKLSGYFIHDNDLKSSLANTTFVSHYNVLNLLENRIQQSNKEFYSSDVDLYFKPSAALELSYVSKINNLNERTIGEIAIMDDNISDRLAGNQRSLLNRFTLLKRLNSKQAISILAMYTLQKNPQNYLLSTQNFFVPNKTNLIQSLNNENNGYQVKATLTGIYKNLNYQFILATIQSDEKLSSNLNLTESSMGKFDNKLKQQQIDNLISATTSKQWGKFTILAKLKLHHLNKVLSDGLINQRLKSASNYIEPNVTFSFCPGEKAKFNLFYEYSLNNYGIDNLYTGYILTDYRLLSNNDVNFNSQNANNIGFSYAYSDFVERQFQFYVLTNYTWHNNSLGSELALRPNYSLSKHVMFPGNRDFLGLMSVSKYIDFISSTIKLNSSFNISSRSNIINSVTRESQLIRLLNELSSRTLLAKGITLILSAKGSLFYSKSNLLQSPSVHNLSSYCGIVIKPMKQFLINLSAETTWGDVYSENKNTINFVDSSLKYTFSENKLAVKLSATNIFDQRYYDNIALTDYQINQIQYKILPRTLMAGIEYRLGK